MEINESWLRQWTNPSLSREELAKKLTMIGHEVEMITPIAQEFSGVIVAKVLETKAHPEADRLTLCKVDTGTEILQIVCGAKNVRAGLKVALAKDGAKLPNNININTTKLRGQLSQGMLCSAKELGWSFVGDGILELPDDAPVGENLKEHYKLDDVRFTLNITPNRADCMSIIGVARDLAAATDTTFQQIKVNATQTTTTEHLVVVNHAQKACPIYCGRLLTEIDNNQISPFWLRDSLQRVGITAINPVVDVLNWVMYETGQPMHGFSVDSFAKQVVIRYAKTDESLTLLNDQTVKLQSNTLVIANEQEALAIAGVMGGKNSATTSATRAIWLESAYFKPQAIAGIARRYGLVTDASQRYERGVDPLIAEKALERATQLLQAIVGGHAGPIIKDYHPEQISQNQIIKFYPESVKKLIGIEITDDVTKKILLALGMEVDASLKPWAVKAPAHRYDIHVAADLVEEIIRIIGYDKIHASPIHTELNSLEINVIEEKTSQIRQILKTRGFHEVINYAFTDNKLHQILYPNLSSKTLLNPIAPELSEMRLGLLPGLLKNLQFNCNRQQNLIKIFETGVVFTPENNTFQEKLCLSGLIFGKTGTDSWLDSRAYLDFYDLKGDLEALFSSLNLAVEFTKHAHPALHPTQTAAIYWQNKAIGHCGTLHPKVTKFFDLEGDPIVFEIYLDNLLQNNAVKQYREISKFPKISRDLALLADQQVEYKELYKIITDFFKQDSTIVNWLRALNIFDVYQGDNIPAGKKSMAISITLQATEKTLLDEDVNQIITAILNLLEQRCSITMRS